jgi:hypothetical protein
VIPVKARPPGVAISVREAKRKAMHSAPVPTGKRTPSPFGTENPCVLCADTARPKDFPERRMGTLLLHPGRGMMRLYLQIERSEDQFPA